LLQRPWLLPSDKGDTARRVESAFDLGDCLYFYVGHACPGYGLVALVYNPEMARTAQGYTTPFDSGWLLLGTGLEALGGEAERKTYLHEVRKPLASWQGAFEDYLARYFRSASDYVLGQRPADPSPPYRHPFSTRVGWTWEVQLHQKHDLFEQLRLMTVAYDVGEAIRSKALELYGQLDPKWHELLLSNHFIQVDPPGERSSRDACERAEQEVASWL